MFGRRTPGVQQRVDDGVELLLRRIPRLEQVMIEVDEVDGVDGGVGVGVGGQQHAARRRVEVHRPLEKFDAAHLRHPVVGDQHGDRLAPQLELLQGLQGVRPRLGPHDAVPVSVLATQVAGDRAGNRGIVVDGQQDRLARLNRGGCGARGARHRG
jgi:hypothetical protein